jgi:hypothetical protein
VALVVFDTAAPVGGAQAVYARATAEQRDDPAGLEVYSNASVAAGLSAWSMEDVTAADGVRLFCATVTELSVLDASTGHRRDERVAVAV